VIVFAEWVFPVFTEGILPVGYSCFFVQFITLVHFHIFALFQR
jgi:hypothetical protein